MENRNCQNCKKDFNIEADDFSFYEKIKFPPPTFCPDCRFQRRLSFRNNRVFYKRNCSLCKKNLICLYNADQSFIVYCHDCWLSDKWDPIRYGRDYDFDKSFFEQFRSLQLSVPRVNLYQTNFQSSEYCNYGLDFKECYLMFGGHNNERIYFGNQVFDSKDSLDISFSEKIESGYELLECQRSNRLFFSHHSEDCVDCSYLIDCKNCINCFGCVGLRNKQYHIFNQPHTKEEYHKFIEENNTGNYFNHLEFLRRLNELSSKQIHRYARVFKSVNSDGDDLYESKNSHFSFSSRQVEDSKFLFFIRNNVKECYDNSFQGFNTEKVYEIAHGFGGSNVAFGVRNLFNMNTRYNEECHDCKDIFGCEGLRKKQYCILNKQYTKEEYETLLPKVIEHMNNMPYVDSSGISYRYGEFFPIELSPFAYNESIAQEYFPITKDQASVSGYSWREPDKRNYTITLKTEDIPESINETDNSIFNEVISCKHGGKCLDQCTEAFKIMPEELKFYKNMNLPLPRLCPNCRHYERIKLRNPIKLWHRGCMCEQGEHGHDGKCPNEFETSYAPDREEIIYCESCYQKEVI